MKVSLSIACTNILEVRDDNFDMINDDDDVWIIIFFLLLLLSSSSSSAASWEIVEDVGCVDDHDDLMMTYDIFLLFQQIFY